MAGPGLCVPSQPFEQRVSNVLCSRPLSAECFHGSPGQRNTKAFHLLRCPVQTTEEVVTSSQPAAKRKNSRNCNESHRSSFFSTATAWWARGGLSDLGPHRNPPHCLLPPREPPPAALRAGSPGCRPSVRPEAALSHAVGCRQPRLLRGDHVQVTSHPFLPSVAVEGALGRKKQQSSRSGRTGPGGGRHPRTDRSGHRAGPCAVCVQLPPG